MYEIFCQMYKVVRPAGARAQLIDKGRSPQRKARFLSTMPTMIRMNAVNRTR